MVLPHGRVISFAVLCFSLTFFSCGGAVNTAHVSQSSSSPSPSPSPAPTPTPTPTPTPPSDPTPGSGSAITACGQTLKSNTAYYLENSIGSSASSQCLTLSGPNTALNLNGYTITGTVKGSGIDANGIHIYGGSITCNDSDPTYPGCIYIGSDATAFTKVLEIDHLRLANASTTSDGSSRNLMIDVGSISQSAISGPNIKVHDNSSVSATGLTSSRIVNLQVQGTAHSNAGYAEFYNNSATCKSTAAACQGIVAYGLYDVKVHNNTLTNQLADAAATETPRAVICDQTDGCEIYSNTIDAQDGRAVRMRGTSKAHDVNSVHDNVIKNIVAGTNQNVVAAVHIGDPDSGTEVENASIYSNTFNVSTGWVFMARSATGITIHDNNVNGSGAISLLDARYASTTDVDLVRTTISGGTATSSCEPGTIVTVCNSGNVIGACTLNNSGC